MSGDSVRQRAHNVFNKWVNTPDGFKVLLVAARDSKTPILAFAEFFAVSESALARREERLECAKAVCVGCLRGNERVGKQHRALDENENVCYFDCAAAAIWERDGSH